MNPTIVPFTQFKQLVRGTVKFQSIRCELRAEFAFTVKLNAVPGTGDPEDVRLKVDNGLKLAPAGGVAGLRVRFCIV